MSEVVAKALISCMRVGEVGQIMMVLDGDEEACRLGYCDAPSLERLFAAAQQYKIPLKRQPGLRIGLLMTDDNVLIWTPTPLMFEAPRHRAEPNGMVLTPQTFKELPQAVGVDPEKSNIPAEIGTFAFKVDEVEKVVAAIKAAPPAPFNLARLSRVFSAKFQFIESVVRGAELLQREMRLDSLIVNSDAPEALRPLLHTTVQPFSTDSNKTVEVGVVVNGELAYRKTGEVLTRPTTQAEMRAYWDALTDQHIVNLPGFGKIIRLTDKAKFEDGRAAFELILKAWVSGFQLVVKGDHGKRVAKVVDLIVSRMEKDNEKEKLARPAIELLVRKGLENLRVIEPGAKVVYKNITVESTRDQEFLDVLKKTCRPKN
ncbi:MAG: hypothetical protein Q8K22_12430 [Rhodoferax sp.]|nr:hypothetical protein [Rhodoferax sp.]